MISGQLVTMVHGFLIGFPLLRAVIPNTHPWNLTGFSAYLSINALTLSVPQYVHAVGHSRTMKSPSSVVSHNFTKLENILLCFYVITDFKINTWFLNIQVLPG